MSVSDSPGSDCPSLSIVIPAFNESDRIGSSLLVIEKYLLQHDGDSEIVVVDDGSTDTTPTIVRNFADNCQLRVRFFRYPNNRGKGYALKVGFAQARGKRILFTDADLSTPIDEADRLLERLDLGFDVAIGSRKMPGAQIIVRQKKFRELLGRGFTWMVRRTIADVSDTTCGFKVFTRNAGKQLFGLVRVYDWSFDAEVLLLTRRLGYRLCEVPVRWEDRVGTKVRLWRDVIGSLQGLATIHANALRGLYERPVAVHPDVETWESIALPDGGIGVTWRATGQPE